MMAATDFFERLTGVAEHALSKLTVRSALNPALFLVALITPFSLLIALWATGPLLIACLVMAFLPVIVSLVGFLYFMCTAPDKLRSEEYELRRFAQRLIEEKGGRIAISPTSVEAITNSAMPLIPGPDGTEPR